MANEFISNIRFEMKKILFLHGFFASGSCPMAMALQEAFDGVVDAVESGALPESRIDESVRRILEIKQKLGIL